MKMAQMFVCMHLWCGVMEWKWGLRGGGCSEDKSTQ